MQETIKAQILATIKQLRYPVVDFVVEHPTDVSNGDYSSNIAMALAGQVGKAPREIAEQFLAALTGTLPQVTKIEVAGVGFLNFYLNREFFTNQTIHILGTADDWGKNNSWAGKKVMVEYTSPNLFKPLHIGNLVGNIVGESITRLFEYSGASVIRLNYPSDIGLTVAKGVWGLQQTGGDPSNIKALGEAYRYGNEAYESDELKKEEIVVVNKALYEGSNDELNQLRDMGIFTSKAKLLTICNSLGTTFDSHGTIFESDAAPKGVTIVKENTPGVFIESEGAVVYEGEKVGLHTRVFLNSKGLPTYEAKDLGNFAIKQDRFPDWTHSIVITGNEQTEYFKVVYAAIKEIFKDVDKNGKILEHIPTGFLTLTTGKMSSRKGNILSGEEMLEDLESEAKKRTEGKVFEMEENDVPHETKVATAAIKYQILKHNIGSNIVFDKEKALSFEGDSGPYLQYTYARIQSLLEKAESVGVKISTDNVPTTTYPVENLLYRFPEIAASALNERAPHLVATYLIQLASEFNSFYAAEKIADVTDEYAPYKAALAKAVGQTLKNGLWVLGIKAPERM